MMITKIKDFYENVMFGEELKWRLVRWLIVFAIIISAGLACQYVLMVIPPPHQEIVHSSSLFDMSVKLHV